MNKHNNFQVYDTQEHTINFVPNNRELTERSKQTVSIQHMDKHHDHINTQTQYWQDQEETRHTSVLRNHKYV